MTATQQSQMIIKPISDFLDGKNADPSRGQLDSERDAVHFANDRLNRAGGILAQLEPWLHVAGSIGKKPGRVRRPWPPGWAVFLHGQWGHWPYQLPRRGRAASGLWPRSPRMGTAQQHLGHTSGRFQDVLTAVKHEQGCRTAQVLHRRFQRRAAGSAAHRFEHGAFDQTGIGQRSQLNQIEFGPAQVTGAQPSSKAKRVLPIPPMPTRVTSRFPARSSDRISSSSFSRPMKVVRGIGGVPVTSTSAVPPTRESGSGFAALLMSTSIACKARLVFMMCGLEPGSERWPAAGISLVTVAPRTAAEPGQQSAAAGRRT